MDIKFKTQDNEIININDSVIKYKDMKGVVHKYPVSDIVDASLSNGTLNIKYNDNTEHDFIMQNKDIHKIRPFISKVTGIEEVIDPTIEKNKLVMISGILTAAYLLFAIFVYSNPTPAPVPADEFSQLGYEIGTAIGYAIILPHFLLVLIGEIFNVLGYFMNKRAFVLTAAILYAVAMVVLPINLFFVVAQMVLCFVAFAKMGKQNN